MRITGTEGLSFAGRVGTAQDRRRVQGSVPEEYEIPFEGAAVTAAIRKREPGSGTLGVEVVRDGRVVASRETSTSTGVVNVVWTHGEAGYVIVLSPAGGRILKGLGLYSKLEELGIKLVRYEVANSKGELLGSYSTESLAEKYGPNVAVCRPELIDLL